MAYKGLSKGEFGTGVAPRGSSSRGRALLGLALLAVGLPGLSCSSKSSSSGNAGGAGAGGASAHSGGGDGAGGVTSTGGAIGMGGASSSGGAGGSGGWPATGGAGGAAGSSGAGGTSALGGAGGISALGGAGGMSALGGAGGMSASGGAGGISATGGAGGVGGVPGSGGVGGAGACGDLIDDMEAGTGHICTGNGRMGHWYTYVDSAAGSSIMPLPTEKPSLPETLVVPRPPSTRAMHVTGAYSSYVGFGCLLNEPSMDAQWSTFDASRYTGIRFYALASYGVRILVQIPGTVTPANLGTCTAATCMGATSPPVPTSVTAWTLVNIPFTSLAGGNLPFDPSLIAAIEFQPVVTGTFDIWIDDLGFY